MFLNISPSNHFVGPAPYPTRDLVRIADLKSGENVESCGEDQLKVRLAPSLGPSSALARTLIDRATPCRRLVRSEATQSFSALQLSPPIDPCIIPTLNERSPSAVHHGEDRDIG